MYAISKKKTDYGVVDVIELIALGSLNGAKRHLTQYHKYVLRDKNM